LEAAGIHSLFAEAGGKFCIPAADIQFKLQKVKAFIFDWDGVFNDGSKRDLTGSGFAEPDAMGTNMLRFSYWLLNNKLPVTAIITGEENESALLLGKRERFSALYFKASNKLKSFEHFLVTHHLKGDEVAFVFDDVLDLGVASQCGVRIAAHRFSNPLFNKFLLDHSLCDYMTSHPGGHCAVREACELLFGLYGKYEEAISNRMQFSDRYKAYLGERQEVETCIFTGLS
jgi:3-deoxy-D-manno-octulosonate 8-phosphate phosphatase (KDO 8-P phosphatase)